MRNALTRIIEKDCQIPDHIGLYESWAPIHCEDGIIPDEERGEASLASRKCQFQITSTEQPPTKAEGDEHEAWIANVSADQYSFSLTPPQITGRSPKHS